MNKDQQQLRQSFDGNDNFMTGFQIGQLKTYKKKIPYWVNNNFEIRKILSSAFPKLKTDAKQRTAAARWANVIHFYFRLRYTYTQIAEELSLTPATVDSLIRNIKRVASGHRANGSGLKSKKRGRPKNRA